MKYYIQSNQENFYDLLSSNSMEQNQCFTFFHYNDDKKIEVKLTRSDLLKKSLDIAAKLKNSGIKKGDKVVILSTQTVDNVLSVVGAMLAGAIFTIIPPPIDPSKMERFISVVKSCNPKFLLCGNLLENKAKEILGALKKKVEVAEIFSNLEVINVEKCEKRENFIPEKIELDDIIYIQYSSGSTSAPKGVLISYGNLISAINCSVEPLGVERIFGWVPFFHNLGLVYLIFTPIIKPEFTIGIMSPSDFLEKPSRWIENLSEFKADSTLAPNSVYESYPKLVPANKLEGIDLSNLKLLLNGSEIVTYSSMKQFADEYKDFGINLYDFLVGYGLAEVTCGATGVCNFCDEQILDIDFDQYQNGKLVLANENTKNKIEFIGNGYTIKHHKIIAVNPDTLEECKEDEFGELWIEGPAVAKGYYNNPKATEETFYSKLKGQEGDFLRTGDFGIVKDGYIYITGRMKELIIINGNNILPNDIVVKLTEKMPALKYANIVPFSIVKEEKERLVLAFELPEVLRNSIEFSNIVDMANKCVLEYFEVSPYEICLVESGALPKSDNGKVSIAKTAKLYEENKLNIANSSRGNNECEYKKNIEYNTDTEKTLGKIITKEFDYNANIGDNLLNMGMDSLEVIQLTTKIEEIFNVTVPVSFVFENPTIKEIGKYIDRTLAGEDITDLEKDKSYLYDEVKLDENIKPGKYENDAPEMKNVFITGTTGFVGAYLIHSLLSETEARLYCHVRAKSEEDALKRIKYNMEYYHLWKEEYREFITPVIGSLDKPLLGIDEEKYKILTETIDTVYHNGALLNFIYPYERLKNTNVGGTIKTLEFACTGKPKYYNYVSSYSVFDNPSHFGKVAMEDDPLDSCIGYYLSYSETKWVCEKIVNLAREAGLRAAIYRPGEITGANDTGIWKLSDSISRTFKSILQTKVYPNIDLKIHMTQVDYIAEAIVKISKQGDAYGKAYNLMNSVYVSISELGRIINKCGYEAKPLSYEEWKENLFNSGNEHPLKLLESLFRITKKNEKEEFVNRYGKMSPTYFDTTNTDKALEGTGLSCEPMNEALIEKYIKNFI
ncbi:hypothetical protein CM240_2252 [Clostridium bornimense]|uniref:Carrier domain-containing protein n=1 Tax=Clostridium bornimense TaxID=1216932 RepID=W6SIC6_9CLOT|nr:thioester reductase domain-containing protein [Clostridium bornimense]CDM69395.1 hypothetical protein CM240_2252 [Clostridium bornimense]